MAKEEKEEEPEEGGKNLYRSIESMRKAGFIFKYDLESWRLEVKHPSDPLSPSFVLFQVSPNPVVENAVLGEAIASLLNGGEEVDDASG
jgi:hypothetical protein